MAREEQQAMTSERLAELRQMADDLTMARKISAVESVAYWELLAEVERRRAREAALVAEHKQAMEIVLAVATGSWWSTPLKAGVRRATAPGKSHQAVVYSAIDFLAFVIQARALLASTKATEGEQAAQGEA